MTCDCPMSSAISGSDELLFLSRVAASISYVIFVACVCRVVWHRSKIRDVLQTQYVVAACVRMLGNLRQARLAVPDVHTRKVRKIMDELREDRCARFGHFVACWSLSFLLLGTYEMHAAGVWTDHVNMDGLRDAVIGGILLKLIPVAGVMVSPISSKTAKVQAAHVAFVLSAMGTEWLYDDVVEHREALAGDIATRLSFALFLGTPASIFTLNAALLGSTVIRSLTSDDFPGALNVSSRGAVIITLLSVFSQKFMQSEARAIVAAMTSESAAQDLLGIMCEAVLVLNEHLVMASPCPNFDALLLRSASPTGGAAGSFPSLFEVVDQKRVGQFLTESDGAAQSLHATLRDVRGSPLRVQLFHKRFENIFGETRHVIGVLEETDVAPPGFPSPHEDLEPRWLPSTSVGSSSSHHRFERSGPNRSPSSSGSIASGSSTDFVSLGSSGRDDLLELQIDTTSPNLLILTSTPSLTRVTGPLDGGTGLLNLVARRDKAPLLRWVQEGGSRPLTVTLQHTRTGRIAHSAMCAMRDGAPTFASRCLVLSDVRCSQHDSASKRQARSADAPRALNAGSRDACPCEQQFPSAVAVWRRAFQGYAVGVESVQIT